MNLLAPDLLAEAFITIGHDGTSHAYYSKIDKKDAIAVASAIVNAGIELAKRYGYQMQIQGAPAGVAAPTTTKGTPHA